MTDNVDNKTKELTATDAKPVRERRISKRVAEVVRLIVVGECKTVKAAAERAGMNYTHVCEKSWPRKFEQADKWSFCLIAAMIAANRRDHEQTTASEPHSGLQGEGGPCGHQGRDDVGSVG